MIHFPSSPQIPMDFSQRHIGVGMMISGSHAVPIATVDQTVKDRGRPQRSGGDHWDMSGLFPMFLSVNREKSSYWSHQNHYNHAERWQMMEKCSNLFDSVQTSTGMP